MVPLAEDLDADKIHVRAPTAVIFICGGEISDVSEASSRSLRDAFLKAITNPALSKYHFIQAEEITKYFLFAAIYEDMLLFETDLAQISELILLFCESEGSLAELGSFVMVREISQHLLVVTRDKHWNRDSFIKHGPFRALENNYGQGSIYVVNDKELNIDGDLLNGLDKDLLSRLLQDPIRIRMEASREPTTFDPNRPGHLIKLIVGLIQEYGALTLYEIDELLLLLNVYVETKKIYCYLLCARVVEWIVEERRGYDTFFIAKDIEDAVTFRVKEGAQERRKERRRVFIREHWKKNDLSRYNGIVAALTRVR